MFTKLRMNLVTVILHLREHRGEVRMYLKRGMQKALLPGKRLQLSASLNLSSLESHSCPTGSPLSVLNPQKEDPSTEGLDSGSAGDGSVHGWTSQIWDLPLVYPAQDSSQLTSQGPQSVCWAMTREGPSPGWNCYHSLGKLGPLWPGSTQLMLTPALPA